MSTINTENLILYSCKKLYNGSRYKVYQTGINYDTWLANTNNSPNNSGNLTVYFKSITEPITIDTPLMNTDTYTYGCITNGVDETHYKKYYFFVDNITTDQNGRSTLTFSIDWWATEWANVQLTKGHITRNKNTKPGYMIQPISDYNMSLTHSNIINTFSIWATYIPSFEGIKSFISYIIMEGNLENVNYVELGNWVTKLGISGSDIKDCFIVPYFEYSYFTTNNQYYAICSENYRGKTNVQDETEKDRIMTAIIDNFLSQTYSPDYGDYVFDTSTGKYWKVIYEQGSTSALDIELSSYPSSNLIEEYITSSSALNGITGKFKMFMLPENNASSRTYSKSLSTQFVSNEITRQGIVDWNGNSIWEAPIDGNTYTFTIRLLLGISHIMLEFLPNITNEVDNSQMLVNKSFCYDCRHPGLFVDSYQDYILKNREYDIQMRRLQSEKQELQAWASTAENIGFGMAFGQTTGAVASGIGGVIEAASTWLLNKHFDPQIQQQYDLRYARMTDQISLVGDSITNVINAINNNTGILKKYSISMNQSSINRYNNDINTNGYYCDETTNNLQLLITRGNVVQAVNVTVEGLICKEGRQQIVYRLQNGVEFI